MSASEYLVSYVRHLEWLAFVQRLWPAFVLYSAVLVLYWIWRLHQWRERRAGKLDPKTPGHSSTDR